MKSERDNASNLANEVRDLVSMPEAYLNIQSLMNDMGATLDDFAASVQTDPGISARVLQMANSAFFGYGRKVDTISFAINLMGISQLHDLVLTTSVINSFSGLPATTIDMAGFWRRSIFCGVLSRMFAEECGIRDSERLFVAGLLHDLGHLILYLRRPVSASDAMRASVEEERPLHETERDRLGFHYGDVGSAWMENWHFPESLVSVCRDQCDPVGGDRHELATSIVHLARHIALSEEPGIEQEQHLAEPTATALAIVDIGEERREELSAEAREFLAEMVSLLLSKKAA